MHRSSRRILCLHLQESGREFGSEWALSVFRSASARVRRVSLTIGNWAAVKMSEAASFAVAADLLCTCNFMLFLSGAINLVWDKKWAVTPATKEGCWLSNSRNYWLLSKLVWFLPAFPCLWASALAFCLFWHSKPRAPARCHKWKLPRYVLRSFAGPNGK